jgi:hypothetical protein
LNQVKDRASALEEKMSIIKNSDGYTKREWRTINGICKNSANSLNLQIIGIEGGEEVQAKA